MVRIFRPQSGRSRGPARLAVGLGLLLCVEACKAPPLPAEVALESALEAPVEVRQRLAYDDVLRIDVYPHAELSSGELGRRIDYDGNIDLPLLGPLHVLGLTVGEVRAALQERAEQYLKDAAISVAVQSYAPRLFYVLGEVQKTGPYEMRRPTTALQALSRAGGIAPTGDSEQVVVLRVEDQRLQVHRFNAQTPGPEGLFPVQPGDLLFVRRTGAGTFSQQMAPYLQALAPPFSAAASILLVTDRLD